MTDTMDPLTAATPAVLRSVGPPAAPWPADLVRAPGGPGLLVDTEELSACGFGEPAEHVLRPSDLFRTVAGGHLALMPGVNHPLRPRSMPRPAALTVAISLLRGLCEAGPGARGEWWLSAQGAPVLVPVRNGLDARVTAAELVAALVDDPFPELAADLTEAGAWDGAAAQAWEDRLFRSGTPGPLVLPGAGEERRSEQPSRRARRRRSGGPLRAFDAGLAAAASDALWDLRRTVAALMRRLAGRKRLLMAVVAGAAATLVVVIGLGLPGGEGATGPPEAPAGSATPPPQTPAVAQEAEGDQADLALVAAGLLSRLRGCADANCRGELMERADAVLPPGVALTDGSASLRVIDDLGGIAVIRADAPGSRSQIVIIVARDGKWLVRDVYDVADQP